MLQGAALHPSPPEFLQPTLLMCVFYGCSDAQLQALLDNTADPFQDACLWLRDAAIGWLLGDPSAPAHPKQHCDHLLSETSEQQQQQQQRQGCRMLHCLMWSCGAVPVDVLTGLLAVVGKTGVLLCCKQGTVEAGGFMCRCPSLHTAHLL